MEKIQTTKKQSSGWRFYVTKNHGGNVEYSKTTYNTRVQEDKHFKARTIFVLELEDKDERGLSELIRSYERGDFTKQNRSPSECTSGIEGRNTGENSGNRAGDIGSAGTDNRIGTVVE